MGRGGRGGGGWGGWDGMGVGVGWEMSTFHPWSNIPPRAKATQPGVRAAVPEVRPEV